MAAGESAEFTLLHNVTLWDLLRSNPGDGLRFSDLVMQVGNGQVKEIQCFALLSDDQPEEEELRSPWVYTHNKPTPLPETGPLIPVVLETLDEAREMLALGRLVGEAVLYTDLRARTNMSRWGTTSVSTIFERRSGVVTLLGYGGNTPDRTKVTSPSKVRVTAIRNVQAQPAARARQTALSRGL